MSQSDQDRVRLAEAMGWKRVTEGEQAWWPAPYVIERIKKEHPDSIAFDYVGFDSLPDPLTDANDDYAVLEWMRTMPFQNGDWQRINPINLPMTNYRIGDYARAALKVLKRMKREDEQLRNRFLPAADGREPFYCGACRACGHIHCAHPDECGALDDPAADRLGEVKIIPPDEIPEHIEQEIEDHITQSEKGAPGED